MLYPPRCHTLSTHGRSYVRSSGSARQLQTALLVLVAFALCGVVPASAASWATGYPTIVGAPTTLSLGGGSTVDLTVTTGGAQGLSNSDLGTAGSVETGLGYANLTSLAIFNAGSTGASVTTTLQFSNFVPGPGHVRGLLMVGAVDELSSSVTLTSSVPGAVQTWTQVGSSFAVSVGNEDPIDWVALTGQITHGAGTAGIDSGGIVLDVGSIAQYETITLTLDQNLADGVFYAIGEEAAAPVPSMAPAAGFALSAALLGLGAAVLNRRSAGTGD